MGNQRNADLLSPQSPALLGETQPHTPQHQRAHAPRLHRPHQPVGEHHAPHTPIHPHTNPTEQDPLPTLRKLPELLAQARHHQQRPLRPSLLPKLHGDTQHRKNIHVQRMTMTPCPTCGYDQPAHPRSRGGKEEDYRAHAQHAHQTADHLQSRETSQTQAQAVRRHAFTQADKGMVLTIQDIHRNKNKRRSVISP